MTTARLPVPASDDNTWGVILNDFLSQSLAADGSIKPGIVSLTALSTAVQASLAKADAANAYADGLRRPRSTTLTDGATITPNSDTTDIALVTIAGNRTMALPTGSPVQGQRLVIRVKQDGAGSRIITWAVGYRFGVDIPTPTLTAIPAKTDYIGFMYNASDATWDGIAFSGGY